MSAMKGVVLLLSPKTGADPVCFIYNEYEVREQSKQSLYLYYYASPEDVSVTRDCSIGE